MFEDKHTTGEMNDQDQQLVGYLERMLATRSEDAQSLARIHERLLKLNEGSLPVSDLDHTTNLPITTKKGRSQSTGGANLRSICSTFGEKKAWLRPLSLIAAVLIVSVIVGSLVLLFAHLRQDTMGNSSRVFSQRQGWAQFVLYSGKGSRTITGQNIVLPRLWGDASTCVGSGKLAIELIGTGMISYEGESPCTSGLSTLVTPQSITFETSSATPKIQMIKVTADANTTWYLEIEQAVVQPTLTFGPEWVQSIGVGGNGGGRSRGEVGTLTKPNGQPIMPKTWAVVFVCFGTGSGHIEFTPTPVSGNVSISSCGGQPGFFIMHYRGPTLVQNVTIDMHGDTIWDAHVLGCADEQKCTT